MLCDITFLHSKNRSIRSGFDSVVTSPSVEYSEYMKYERPRAVSNKISKPTMYIESLVYCEEVPISSVRIANTVNIYHDFAELMQNCHFF